MHVTSRWASCSVARQTSPNPLHLSFMLRVGTRLAQSLVRVDRSHTPARPSHAMTRQHQQGEWLLSCRSPWTWLAGAAPCDRCVSVIDIILGAGPDCFCAPRKARACAEVAHRSAAGSDWTAGCDHEDGRNKT